MRLVSWVTEACLKAEAELVYKILTLGWVCSLGGEHRVNFLDFFHGWLGICLHCHRVCWPLSLMHIAHDSPSPFPAGHGGADPELWTDAIAVAHWAPSTSELRHAPGERDIAANWEFIHFEPKDSLQVFKYLFKQHFNALHCPYSCTCFLWRK